MKRKTGGTMRLFIFILLNLLFFRNLHAQTSSIWLAGTKWGTSNVTIDTNNPHGQFCKLCLEGNFDGKFSTILKKNASEYTFYELLHLVNLKYWGRISPTQFDIIETGVVCVETEVESKRSFQVFQYFPNQVEQYEKSTGEDVYYYQSTYKPDLIIFPCNV